MNRDYERLERRERAPRKVVDHSARWEKLVPIATVNGQVQERILAFCERKRITIDALHALGTRVAVRSEGRIELAFGGDNGAGAVTAIKYRPIGGTSHDSFAENPSTWLRPIVAGNRESLDWMVAEGETDAARLCGLIGDMAAVMVLPAGARTFRPEWAHLIPRGARVAIAHDADDEGDAGAAKAAKLIGPGTVRVRPPIEGGDWCDWDGDRDDLLALLQASAAEARAEFHWTPLADVVVKPITYIDEPWLQASAFHLLAGIKNAGKGTWLALIAARVTSGEYGPKRHVLWIALGEDSYSIDVKPRILAAGGDPAHVTVLQESRFVLPEHAAELERKASELGNVGMIVLDPVGGAMQAGKSTNFDADVRPALQALNRVADSTEAMVFGVRHFSIKPERRREGMLAAILGSSDWINVPRSVLALLHDDADPQTRHLFVATGNRGRDDTPGLMLRLEGHLLDGHEHEVTRMRVLGDSAKDPDELLAGKKPRQASKSDAARKLILHVLHAADGHTMESDQLDHEVAKGTGLEARTVGNIRTQMRKEGLVRPVPQKDDEGEVKRWFVTLTGAGEAAFVNTTTIENTRSLQHTTSRDVDYSSHITTRGCRDLEVTRDLDAADENVDFVTPAEAVAEAVRAGKLTAAEADAVRAMLPDLEGGA